MNQPGPSERLDLVRRAIDDVRAGKMVILADDEDRENEGDLVMAADLVTPEAINFMARHGRGLICLSLTEERVEQLGLPMMVNDNRSTRGTAFTASIDARAGITTGISARERAETVRVAVASHARPEDLVTPGHVFPLRARRGGVLVRSGHTEASVDMARLAGREPAAVICEIMREDGEMARMPELKAFAQEHGVTLLSIADLIEYRLGREMLVRRTAEGVLRPFGGSEFRAYVYTTDVEDTEYLALVLGTPDPATPVLVRVQTASMMRDVFGSSGSGTAEALAGAARLIEAAGAGVLLYVFPRGRASLLADFHANVPGAALGSSPLPGPVGDDSRFRAFGLGAQVLAELGVRRIRLVTNNPRRIVGLEGFGLSIVERVPFGSAPASPVLAPVLPIGRASS